MSAPQLYLRLFCHTGAAVQRLTRRSRRFALTRPRAATFPLNEGTMMTALRGNLAILALAPALVMLVLTLAVMRPAQAHSAFARAGLVSLETFQPAPYGLIARMASKADTPDGGTPVLPGQGAPCKIMLCTGIMGFPLQEQPQRVSVPAGTLLLAAPAPYGDPPARQDDPPPKPHSSNFS